MHNRLSDYTFGKHITITHDPFEGNKIETTAPTSESQKEIWLSCKLGGKDANLAYNQSFSLELEGRIDKRSLKSAFKTLITRHEALRSSVSSDGESLIVYESSSLEIDEIKIPETAAHAYELWLSKQIEKEVTTPLNLTTGPLLRCTLVQLRSDLHYLILTAHHIVADGWSIGVMLKEIGLIYSCYSLNRPVTLPSAPKISSYLNEEIKYKKSQDHNKTEQFWLDLYKSNTLIVNIQTDFPRPKFRKYKSKRIDCEIPNSLIYGLRGVANNAGCSIATLLISAFELFMYKITYQNETIVGIPVAGQPGSENAGLVGHCTNLLPLKSKIDASLSFRSYMKNRKAEILDAYDNQRFTFGELIKKLSISRDPSKPTLVPVVLNVDLNFGDSIAFFDLKHQIATNPRAFENFEIFLNINHNKEKTVLEWAYNTSLFTEERIKTFHTVYRRLLEVVSSNPTLSLDSIIFNKKKNSLEQPVRVTLLELLYESLEHYSGNTAILSGRSAIKYRELDAKSNRVARMLIQNGIEPGDSVGLITSRSIDTISSILAILKAGAVYVPIDPTLPTERVDYILKDANVKLLFCSSEQMDAFRCYPAQMIIEDALRAASDYPSEMPQVMPDEHAATYILYTSGSTGRPKGVRMGQRALTNLLLWQRENSLAATISVTAHFSSLSFDVSFQEIFSTIISGGQLVLVPNEVRKDPGKLLKLLDLHRVNRLFMPFVALQSLAETAVNSGIFPQNLKEVITAGEQLKVTHYIRTFFNNIPGSRLHNQYGPTESHVVTELKLAGNPTNWPSLPTIGKEIYNTQILILNKDLQEVRPGEIGEICISGLCLADGYVNLNEINESRFLTIVTKNGEDVRIYRSGDLGRRLPDENIEFLGRLDKQIKIRGFRVEPGEIEAQLASMVNVKDAVVIGHGDDSASLSLTAYVVGKTGNEKLEPANLKDELGKFLPEHMVPQHIIFLDELPLTNSGKIDRLRLPKPIAYDRKPSSEQEAPSSPTEDSLSRIWTEFLNVKNISKYSNFFELGGHSIIAVRVMLAVQKEFGIKLPISALFETPTIKQLAETIDRGKATPKWQALVPISTKGHKKPLYLIHGGGYNVLTFGPLSNYMDPDQPLYALQGLGLYDKSKLLTSIEEIAAYYISEIFEIDPTGPYSLGGYSSGGILAYEMARQMLQRGKKVSLLALLDTGADICKADSKTISDKLRNTVSVVGKTAFYARSLFLKPRETVRYIKGKVVRSRESTDLIDINNKYREAFQKYRIKPLPLKIVLFKAKKRIYYAKDPVSYGWDRFAVKGLEIHDVEGDHNTFILHPYAETFARQFQSVIDDKSQKLV